MAAPAFVRFLRPATLPAVVAGVLGGAVAATAATGNDTQAWQVVAAILSALLLTGASNGINQVADVETDRVNRPDRPLPSGAMTVARAWGLIVVLASAALALAALVNPEYLACVALTIPTTTAYSLPPFRLKRIPFAANAAIATPRGLLMVVAGWAAGGGFYEPDAWVLGGLAGLYIFGAATTKDFADVEGDRATKCVTLPILWGPKPAARFVAPFLVVPFAAYPAAAALGWLGGGITSWIVLGGALALVGLVAGTLLVRDPAPPSSGRPHPAWGLMYLQLAAAHLGTAVVYLIGA